MKPSKSLGVLSFELAEETGDGAVAFGGGAFDDITEQWWKGLEKMAWGDASLAVEWVRSAISELAGAAGSVARSRLVVEHWLLLLAVGFLLEIGGHGAHQFFVGLEHHSRLMADGIDLDVVGGRRGPRWRRGHWGLLEDRPTRSLSRGEGRLG